MGDAQRKSVLELCMHWSTNPPQTYLAKLVVPPFNGPAIVCFAIARKVIRFQCNLNPIYGEHGWVLSVRDILTSPRIADLKVGKAKLKPKPKAGRFAKNTTGESFAMFCCCFTCIILFCVVLLCFVLCFACFALLFVCFFAVFSIFCSSSVKFILFGGFVFLLICPPHM